MTLSALILVDVQNDFCPGGSLAVPDGDQVVGPLNLMISHARRNGWLVVATGDQHPRVTTHFDVWPVHCVQNTFGAAFRSDLDIDAEVKVVSKGQGPTDNAYSGFDGQLPDGTTLAQLLHSNAIDRVFIGGLATDYCVKATAMDAVAGFETVLLTDACRAVNINPGDEVLALAVMAQAGIEFRATTEILEVKP